MEKSYKLPSFSVVVTGFNQENCIRSAIESAFQQDYAGDIEFILTDDSSSDATFDIMQEMASSYHGAHTVRLNRNEQNLGISSHLEKVYAMASHEWVVRMDGDDRSMPYRLSMMAQAIAAYPEVDFISADIRLVRHSGTGPVVFPEVEPAGELEAEMYKEGTVGKTTLGASCAVRMRDRCGLKGIERLPMAEDLYEAHYAWLHNRLLIVHNKLVFYVEHSSNISRINPDIKNRDLQHFWQETKRLRSIFAYLIETHEAMSKMSEDFLASSEEYSREHVFRVEENIRKRRQYIQWLYLEKDWMNMSLRQKLKHAHYFKKNLLRLLPSGLYATLLCAIYRLRHASKRDPNKYR